MTKRLISQLTKRPPLPQPSPPQEERENHLPVARARQMPARRGVRPGEGRPATAPCVQGREHVRRSV